MKRVVFGLIILTMILSACASGKEPASETAGSDLVVTDGTTEMTYKVADLEVLPASEATFNEISYVGVSLITLLEDAGFTPSELKAVKAVAADGYSVNYDPQLFLREDVIVAYATTGGSLSTDDGTFRMVLPGEEGKLNIRMLVKLQVVP